MGGTAKSGGKVCVIGSFMYDLVVEAPRRPGPGETLRGTAFRPAPGGKGFNQAVAAARAGAQTVVLGSLGRDEFGQTFLAALQAEGIDTSLLRIDPVLGTGVGLPVVEPGGENSIIIVPRANLGWTAAGVRACAGAIEQADVVLTQFEVPMECVLEVARIGHAAGVTVVVNPAPYAPVPADLLPLVDVLTPNEQELLALAGGGLVDGRAAVTPGVLEAAARAVAARAGAAVVVTLGDQGALLVLPDGTTDLVPGRPVDAVDTVGAGDAFCGHLAAALARGEALPSAVRVANVAASIAVTRRGSAAAPHLAEALAAA